MDYEKFMEEVRLREKDIVRLRHKGMTYLQIANKYQITAERVRQILVRTNPQKTGRAIERGPHMH
jgi:DNA-directed RNA polymerase sigma subunit (sigma70/sigma32)